MMIMLWSCYDDDDDGKDDDNDDADYKDEKKGKRYLNRLASPTWSCSILICSKGTLILWSLVNLVLTYL